MNEIYVISNSAKTIYEMPLESWNTLRQKVRGELNKSSIPICEHQNFITRLEKNNALVADPMISVAGDPDTPAEDRLYIEKQVALMSVCIEAIKSILQKKYQIYTDVHDAFITITPAKWYSHEYKLRNFLIE